MNQAYIQTARLLLEAAPEVFVESPFAMKGGTAINLFRENMPRLSVDIDVVFADHTMHREHALIAITDSLTKIRERLMARGIAAELRPSALGEETKIFVRREVVVKIEVNHVFRGSILPIVRSRLVPEARSLITVDVEVPTLARSELYGSKLVAAMDRRHPRDLFDVRSLYATTGLTPEIVECFVCYLAGHNRPVHEVLFSREANIAESFENESQGMTRDVVTLDELLSIRRQLRIDLPNSLLAAHRNFLLGLVRGEPDWTLMSCPHLSEMPAIRWKLQNLAKLNKSNLRKFAEQFDELRTRFEH